MYLQFIKQNLQPSLEEERLLNHPDVTSLFELTQVNRGFVRYYTQENTELTDHPDVLPLFQKFLINYEYQTTDLDGSYLRRPHFIHHQAEIHTEPIHTWLTGQLCVLPYPPILLETLKAHLSLEAILENHADQMIDVVQQLPNYDSFANVPQNNHVKRLRLGDYISYMKNPNKPGRFGVNVDIADWELETSLLQHLVPQALIRHDHLVFLRGQVLGVNTPQLYLKVPGVWTGGHQENAAAGSLNLNHGPADCLWITMDADDIPLLLEKQPDIFKHEGLWFREVDYFLRNRLPIRVYYQRPGDLILLGPGCLHWVRSMGMTVNSSWNFLEGSPYAFKQMYKRNLLHEKIKKPIVVPMKSLMLDIYLHRGYEFLREYLLEYCAEELRAVKEKAKSVTVNTYVRQVMQCDSCSLEIFLAVQKQGRKFLCYRCIGSGTAIELKYEPNLLLSVIRVGAQQCSELYCSKYYGKAKCKAVLKHQIEVQSEKKVSKMMSMQGAKCEDKSEKKLGKESMQSSKSQAKGGGQDQLQTLEKGKTPEENKVQQEKANQGGNSRGKMDRKNLMKILKESSAKRRQKLNNSSKSSLKHQPAHRSPQKIQGVKKSPRKTSPVKQSKEKESPNRKEPTNVHQIQTRTRYRLLQQAKNSKKVEMKKTQQLKQQQKQLQKREQELAKQQLQVEYEEEIGTNKEQEIRIAKKGQVVQEL